MRITRNSTTGNGYVRLILAKGVLVILTVEEYARALYRGKIERRAQRRQRHNIQAQARQDAARLAWIEKERHR